MAKVIGASFLIKVNTGTTLSPTYTTVGGQKTGTLSLSTATADSTDKGSGDWTENLPTHNSWTISGDGNADQADNGMVALEAAWLGKDQLLVRVETPSGATYTGLATITELSYDGPHDDMFSFNVSLQGSGALSKA